jgi:thymidine phosphorylase
MPPPTCRSGRAGSRARCWSSAARRGRDNRKIARLAKLAGAPEAKAAGVEMHVRLGEVVAAGQPLCTVHAETPGELDYAIEYAASTEDIVRVEPR